jgi:membrane protein
MRPMDPLARLGRYIDWLISHPVAELSRAQRYLRFAVDLTRHCSRELRHNDAGQMAAALCYRTIFGLVPLLMVSMLAFRLFGDMDAAFRKLQTAAYAFLNYDVDPGRPEAAAFKAELDDRLMAVTASVSGLSFETIGAVGALLLIWAAIGLLVSLENAANRIYRAPRGRGTLHRIVVYWAVLTLGPILLLTILYAVEFWSGWGRSLPLVGALFAHVPGSGALVGSFFALLVLYKLMPNTAVRWRPALSGAAVAALLWSASKWGFGLYVSQALPYLRLYGALGLVPLFLFWLYVNWVIILFGLELAFTLQAMRGRAFEPPGVRNSQLAGDPRWLFPIMEAIGRAFARGVPVSRQEIAEVVDLRLEAVAELLSALEAEGLVHQVARPGSEDVGLSLALPPEKIELGRLVDLVARLSLGSASRKAPGWSLLMSLQAADRNAVAGRSLASLLASADQPQRS